MIDASWGMEEEFLVAYAERRDVKIERLAAAGGGLPILVEAAVVGLIQRQQGAVAELEDLVLEHQHAADAGPVGDHPAGGGIRCGLQFLFKIRQVAVLEDDPFPGPRETAAVDDARVVQRVRKKHIVRSHGGEVTAASEGLGKGASFLVEIPLSERRSPSF